MIRKTLAALALAITLVVTGGIGGLQRANAYTAYSCNDNWICFYNYQSFDTAGGSWGIRIYPNGTNSYAYGKCITMPTSGTTFTNGTAYNAATSIVINNAYSSSLEIYSHFYDGNNCSGIPLAHYTAPNTTDLAYPSLAAYGWNDKIGSFKITTYP